MSKTDRDLVYRTAPGKLRTVSARDDEKQGGEWSSTVGQLPPLTARQKRTLEGMNALKEGISYRLARDGKYSLTVPESVVYISEETTRQEYADYPRMAEQLIAIEEDEEQEEYVQMIVDTVKEFIKRAEGIMEDGIPVAYDLIEPRIIPNSMNAETRARVRDMLSVIYLMSRMDSIIDDYMLPYEIMFDMQTLAEGSNASTYTAKYMGQYPMIVKTSVSLNILHEYLVGMVMNRLRKDIANYMYTYGLIPYMHVDVPEKPGAAFFTQALSKDLNSLVLEYIQNAIELSNITANVTATVHKNGIATVYEGLGLFRLLLLQILCAMIYAYHAVGFVHRDPHGMNILVVTLPSVQAVPIMIPVSYSWSTDSRRKADIQFEKRYILTNVLIVFIDYGLSSVDATHLHSEVFKYDRLISLEPYYSMFEGRSSFENDMVIMLHNIETPFTAMLRDRDADAVAEVYDDIVRILYRMYTGTVLDDSKIEYDTLYSYISMTIAPDGNFNYFQTNPRIKYDAFGAVIDFCNSYANMYTVYEYNTDIYKSVLDRRPDNARMNIITESRQYYWYDMYRDSLPEYSVDMDSIISNLWYRENYIAQWMSLTAYRSTNMTNLQLCAQISEYCGHNPAMMFRLLLSMYKYALYFSELNVSLDFSPFKISKPEDILAMIKSILRANRGRITKDLLGESTYNYLHSIVKF